MQMPPKEGSYAHTPLLLKSRKAEAEAYGAGALGEGPGLAALAAMQAG